MVSGHAPSGLCGSLLSRGGGSAVAVGSVINTGSGAGMEHTDQCSLAPGNFLEPQTGSDPRLLVCQDPQASPLFGEHAHCLHL